MGWGLQNTFNDLAELSMGTRDRELWSFNGEALGRAIECAIVSHIDHRKVVVGIARCEGVKIERLEGFDRLALMVFETQGIVGDATRIIDF